MAQIKSILIDLLAVVWMIQGFLMAQIDSLARWFLGKEIAPDSPLITFFYIVCGFLFFIHGLRVANKAYGEIQENIKKYPINFSFWKWLKGLFKNKKDD